MIGCPPTKGYGVIKWMRFEEVISRWIGHLKRPFEDRPPSKAFEGLSVAGSREFYSDARERHISGTAGTRLLMSIPLSDKEVHRCVLQS